MKKSFRLALLAGASFVGLAVAGSALATYQPSLRVEQSNYRLGAPFTMDLFIAPRPSDDPTAKLTIFSPAGYGVNLSKAPGTKLGTALARVQLGQLANEVVTLTGDVLVANPADPTIMATSTKCTGSPTNQAVLVLNLSLQGQTIPFPVFANKVGPLSTFQVCVPHPSAAPLGARVLALDATIAGVFTNASARGGYEWSTLFTPYNTTTKLPNPAGTVEWRTYVGLPSSLTLVKVKAKRGFKLVGKVSIAGVDMRGAKLELWAGKKRLPAPTATSFGTGKLIAHSAALRSTGKYTFTRKPLKFATFFQTRFDGYSFDSCDPPSPTGQPFPCIGEDIASVTSNQVKVTKARKKKH